MKRHLLTTLVLICLVSFLATAGVLGSPQTPIIPATVAIDTVDAQPGATVTVPIELTASTISIAAMYIPISYDVGRLSFDSVSFNGSIFNSSFSVNFNPLSGGLVNILVIPNISQGEVVPVTVTTGLVATVFLHVLNSAAPGAASVAAVYSVDTTDGVEYSTYPQVSDNDGNTSYTLGVTDGAVLVQMPTGVNDNNDLGLPTEFDLAQNYPNPFNPTTMISFSLPKADHVTLEVFNVLGQKVSTLMDKNLSAGRYQVEFDATSQPSGIYFYRLASGQGVSTKKMVLVK
jgi:hypothetical protein